MNALKELAVRPGDLLDSTSVYTGDYRPAGGFQTPGPRRDPPPGINSHSRRKNAEIRLPELEAVSIASMALSSGGSVGVEPAVVLVVVSGLGPVDWLADVFSVAIPLSCTTDVPLPAPITTPEGPGSSDSGFISTAAGPRDRPSFTGEFTGPCS